MGLQLRVASKIKKASVLASAKYSQVTKIG